jgi:hypothetical protein
LKTQLFSIVDPTFDLKNGGRERSFSSTLERARKGRPCEVQKAGQSFASEEGPSKAKSKIARTFFSLQKAGPKYLRIVLRKGCTSPTFWENRETPSRLQKVSLEVETFCPPQ